MEGKSTDSGRHQISNKRKRETPGLKGATKSSRTNTPLAYARRTPPRDSSTEQKTLNGHDHDDGDQSPPRKLKRPGASSRIAPNNREAVERIRKQQDEEARQAVVGRQGSNTAVVAQHYNAVPQFGREWRQAESKISGLRNLNNWIKSTLIQKFSRPEYPTPTMRVLDMACGKGGDLGKWEKAPQPPALYVGCDIASVSVEQARERYLQNRQRRRGHSRAPPMQAEFYVHDAFGRSLVDLPAVRTVGFDPLAGPGHGIMPGQGAAGFDVVSIMFALHYSFETEQLARCMLGNVSGALRKGGKFFGVMPNSDVISAHVKRLLSGDESVSHAQQTLSASAHSPPPSARSDGEAEEDWDPERPSDASARLTDGGSNDQDDDDDDWNPEEPSEPTKEEESAAVGVVAADSAIPVSPVPREPLRWGNSIYQVSFPREQPLTKKNLPKDGIFRPPFGWRYHYNLEEAVDAPEYVVPWEALRALAEEYGLELLYRKGFREVFESESEDRELGMLAERMHVLSRNRSEGNRGLLVSDEEMEAASFYHAFCFYKT